MTIDDHYRAIAPKLTSYLVGSGSSYDVACDIVQEMFVRIWKHREDLVDDPAQVSGLAFTIARNYRKDLARKAKREVLQADITDADFGAGEDSTMQAPEERYVPPARPGELDEETAAVRKRLDAALKEVPPLLREAFLLFQLGELSIREIAVQTGVSESLVKVRIYRAKEKLKVLLKDLMP